MRILDSLKVFDSLPGRPSSHCATVTETPQGLLAAWYSGTREGALDVGILTANYRDGRWDEPRVIIDTPGKSDGNPLLYTLPDGRLKLFYVTQQGRGWDSVLACYMTSEDAGETWSAAELFVERNGIMFRCRPIRLSTGRLLLPAYDEVTWDGLCYVSDDAGDTWQQAGRMTAPTGCIQPAVVERADGSLLAYLRTGEEGDCIWQSNSSDGGESWTPCACTALPNPNAGIDMIRLRPGMAVLPGTTGRLVLAYNPLKRGRHQLALATSEDEGATWQWVLVEDEPGQEFSYPTLLQAPDGLCHLLYTYRRESIKHVIFEAG